MPSKERGENATGPQRARERKRKEEEMRSRRDVPAAGKRAARQAPRAACCAIQSTINVTTTCYVLIIHRHILSTASQPRKSRIYALNSTRCRGCIGRERGRAPAKAAVIEVQQACTRATHPFVDAAWCQSTAVAHRASAGSRQGAGNPSPAAAAGRTMSWRDPARAQQPPPPTRRKRDAMLQP